MVAIKTEQQETLHYQREEKREALMRYIDCKAEERRAENTLIQFRIARSGVKGIAYDRKGSGSGGGAPRMQIDYQIEQQELEANVRNARAETDRIKKIIIRWMGNTSEEKSGLLRLRYIRGMDMNFIARLFSWSRGHVYRQLDAAVDALPEIPKELLT